MYKKEELILKGTNVGANQKMISVFLDNFLKGHILFEGKQTIENFAHFLYNLDFFYVLHANGYKRMKYRSILRELRMLINEMNSKKKGEEIKHPNNKQGAV